MNMFVYINFKLPSNDRLLNVCEHSNCLLVNNANLTLLFQSLHKLIN